MGSLWLKMPEIELSELEAKKLAEAVVRVQKEFGVSVLSPKAAALINLGIVGAGVYGTRYYAIKNNRKKAKAAKSKANGAATDVSGPGPVIEGVGQVM
jgi:hypothetical protein